MSTARKKTVITPQYDKHRAKIDTGDIILFSGKGVVSGAIKRFSMSKWSHVGMALRLPEYDFLLLWESTMISDIKDFHTGRPVQGVRLVMLSEYVKKYDVDVAVRHLSVERTAKMLEGLMRFRKKVRGRPYEEDMVELIKAAYDGPFGQNVEDFSSIFCSELIAETYQKMGLLSGKIPANEYTPGDFASDAKNRLNLLKGAKLNKEVYLRKAG